MPKLPRGITQQEAIRAFERAGGAEVPLGKGGHRSLRMPNGALIVLPMHIKTGLLAAQVRRAGLTVEEFIEKL
jgi:predicted RNA binding protein YcfA (HicA-like mRNA interferase family)